MIKRHNTIQLLLAGILAMVGVVCCWLAFLFFRYLPAFVLGQFGYHCSIEVAWLMGFAGLGAACWSGYQTWKERGGLFEYHESALYHELDGESAGSLVVDHYAHRVTAPAYLLGQVFMAGPLLLLKAWSKLQNRIPDTPALTSRLESVLSTIRAANKWQTLTDYPNSQAEILYLAKLGAIDFSAHKGTPRFKIR